MSKRTRQNISRKMNKSLVKKDGVYRVDWTKVNTGFLYVHYGISSPSESAVRVVGVGA